MEIEGRGGGAGVKKGVLARVRAREIVTSQTEIHTELMAPLEQRDSFPNYFY